VTGWLVPSAGQKIPEQPGWYLLLQKVPLAENRFLHAANGAENTKEKSRQCFPCRSDVSRCHQNLVIILCLGKTLRIQAYQNSQTCLPTTLPLKNNLYSTGQCPTHFCKLRL
jgi:hypothetical protein